MPLALVTSWKPLRTIVHDLDYRRFSGALPGPISSHLVMEGMGQYREGAHRTVVPPAAAISEKALFISVVLYPDNPTQYAFPLRINVRARKTERAQVTTHPTTVYFEPFRVNLVPEVLTNPVEAGVVAVVVVPPPDVEVVATVVVADPT